jgi:hypothetical protein
MNDLYNYFANIDVYYVYDGDHAIAEYEVSGGDPV